MNAKARYDAIVDDVLARNDDCEAMRMMGMPCLKQRGKIVAGFSGKTEEMVFKLPDAAARAQALALDGAHLFDPSGKGRPFKEWVALPARHADDWPRLAEQALRR